MNECIYIYIYTINVLWHLNWWLINMAKCISLLLHVFGYPSIYIIVWVENKRLPADFERPSSCVNTCTYTESSNLEFWTSAPNGPGISWLFNYLQHQKSKYSAKMLFMLLGLYHQHSHCWIIIPNLDSILYFFLYNFVHPSKPEKIRFFYGHYILYCAYYLCIIATILWNNEI
jgi:hypothetical protein